MAAATATETEKTIDPGDVAGMMSRDDKKRITPPRPRRSDPEPRTVHYRFISVDDHLVEPRDVFHGRIEDRYKDACPRVERGDDGGDYWHFEDVRNPITGVDAEMSWERADWYRGPVNFDEMRPGVYDIHERVRDMDIGGVYASLNFPSSSFGFCGQQFSRMKDRDLGLASMRAYNRWVLEGWAGPYPDRIIANQVPWLLDPEIAAQEIYKNAEAGFKAVAFTENPDRLGYGSLWTDYWDPFFRACEETETVVNLHAGSSSWILIPSVHSPSEVYGPLFGVGCYAAVLEYLFAKVPVRFPGLKFSLSEGGIGWVPMLHDRIRYDMTVKRMQPGGFGDAWGVKDLTPIDVVKRNFYFCTFHDPTGFQHRHEIGLDKIMLECDYPHPDSTWPDAQDLILRTIGHLPEEEIEAFAWRNAANLFRHPVTAPLSAVKA